MAMMMTATRQKWLDWVEGWEKSGLAPEEFAASEGEPVTAYRLKSQKVPQRSNSRPIAPH